MVDAVDDPNFKKWVMRHKQRDEWLSFSRGLNELLGSDPILSSNPEFFLKVIAGELYSVSGGTGMIDSNTLGDLAVASKLKIIFSQPRIKPKFESKSPEIKQSTKSEAANNRITFGLLENPQALQGFFIQHPAIHQYFKENMNKLTSIAADWQQVKNGERERLVKLLQSKFMVDLFADPIKLVRKIKNELGGQNSLLLVRNLRELSEFIQQLDSIPAAKGFHQDLRAAHEANSAEAIKTCLAKYRWFEKFVQRLDKLHGVTFVEQLEQMSAEWQAYRNSREVQQEPVLQKSLKL